MVRSLKADTEITSKWVVGPFLYIVWIVLRIRDKLALPSQIYQSRLWEYIMNVLLSYFWASRKQHQGHPSSTGRPAREYSVSTYYNSLLINGVVEGTRTCAWNHDELPIHTWHWYVYMYVLRTSIYIRRSAVLDIWLCGLITVPFVWIFFVASFFVAPFFFNFFFVPTQRTTRSSRSSASRSFFFFRGGLVAIWPITRVENVPAYQPVNARKASVITPNGIVCLR